MSAKPFASAAELDAACHRVGTSPLTEATREADAVFTLRLIATARLAFVAAPREDRATRDADIEFLRGHAQIASVASQMGDTAAAHHAQRFSEIADRLARPQQEHDA